MEFFFIIRESIIPLFLVLLVAIFYERKFNPDMGGMNAVALQLLCPLLIYKQVTDSGYGITEMIPMLLFMLCYTIAMALIGTSTARVFHMPENRSIPFISNAALMNFGNMGIPLILFSFGPEAMPAAIMVWIVFNIPLSTYGLWLSDNERSIKRVIHNFVKVPIFPAFMLAILTNEFGLTVPEMLAKPMDFLGAATVPVMTLIYGFQIAHIKYKPGMAKILLSCVVVRLMISPVVALLIIQFFHLESLTAQTAVVMVSTPMASSPIMYAMVFKRDYELTTAIVLATTLVSAVTLPLVIIVSKALL